MRCRGERLRTLTADLSNVDQCSLWNGITTLTLGSCDRYFLCLQLNHTHTHTHTHTHAHTHTTLTFYHIISYIKLNLSVRPSLWYLCTATFSSAPRPNLACDIWGLTMQQKWKVNEWSVASQSKCCRYDKRYQVLSVSKLVLNPGKRFAQNWEREWDERQQCWSIIEFNIPRQQLATGRHCCCTFVWTAADHCIT